MVLYGYSEDAGFVLLMKVTGMKTLDLGQKGEDIAAEFLEGRRFDILERNYKCVFGEIDIIAGKGDMIAFVEVKTRRGMAYGRPYEAVGTDKQKHMRKVAEFYLRKSRDRGENLNDKEFRFDVVEILMKDKYSRINYIENAF